MFSGRMLDLIVLIRPAPFLLLIIPVRAVRNPIAHLVRAYRDGRVRTSNGVISATSLVGVDDFCLGGGREVGLLRRLWSFWFGFLLFCSVAHSVGMLRVVGNF